MSLKINLMITWNGGNATGRILLYKKTKEGKVLIDDIITTNIGCEYG